MELPQNIKLIIFDFDGTLHDMVLDWESARKAAGVQDEESIADAVERFKQSGNHASIKELERHEADALRSEVLKPKVAETLKRLGQKYKIAVLSRNSSRPLEDFFKRSGAKIDYIVGREEVNKLKPHPEGLELIIKKFAYLPEEILLVGDTWHDVELARTAGIKSVVVGNNYSPRDESIKPDYQLDSVSELIN